MHPGANVAGWFRAQLGLGAAAELVVMALDAVDTPVAPVEARPLLPHANGRRFQSLSGAIAPYGNSILCVNGDYVSGLREELPDLFEGKRRIGYWWWEVVDAFPDSWRNGFEHLDEVWVGSEHVRRAIEPHCPLPVIKVGLPITSPAPAPLDRRDLGLPPGFVFSFFFDFYSGVGRKNPLGAIDAFCEAFRPGEGPSLVIKCSNGEHHAERVEDLRAAAARHPDVHLLDGYRSEREVAALLAASDCYVSLHRSEGFGLPLAEALYLGLPVIATGYGGNLDFMTPENSWLLDHRPVPVGESGADYPPAASWAEPDVDGAGRAMREVFERPEVARRRALRGAADVRRDHSPAAVGAAMRARLRAGEYQAPATPRREIGEARHWVTRGGTAPKSPWLRPARAALLRLMQPHTAYQSIVDATLLRAAEAAEERVRALEVAQAETLAELRKLRAELAGTTSAGNANGGPARANRSERLRLAVFTPLRPQRTGVARSSEALLPHLAKDAEVELFVDGFAPASPEVTGGFRWFDWRAQPQALDRLDSHDAVIYHVANNADFHGRILELALQRPGIVLLHDFALQHLFHQRAAQLGDPSAYLDPVEERYGAEERLAAEGALARGETPPLVSDALRYPLNEELAARSIAVAVHSQWAAERLRETVPAAHVRVVPHPSIAPAGTSGLAEDRRGDGPLIVASFGVMTPAKGIEPAIRALSALRPKTDFRYWIVGDLGGFPEVERLTGDTALGGLVTATGWVDDGELDRRLLATDVAINLRERWHGEASGIVGRLCAAGVPTVVSDVGWFSELPDDAVVKVAQGDQAALRRALASLMDDPSLRRRVGARAQELSREHSPERAAAAQLGLVRSLGGALQASAP